MIQRDHYLKKLIDAKGNGFPKVITGIRRCGKSYLLSDIYKGYLLENGAKEEDILFLDLDRFENAQLRDPLYLGDYIMGWAKGKERTYVMLDEIQRVYTIVNPNLTKGEHVLAKEGDEETISFVDVVLSLARQSNIDLYVTGSNSKMLSSDIVTEFRDKATNIHIAPLSFGEFYAYRQGEESKAIYEYLRYGGMPLAVLKGKEEKAEYLKSLFATTYFRDILERNRIAKGSALEDLCTFLSSSVGQLINADKISRTYESVTRQSVDSKTVGRYISFFLDAFLLSEAGRFDLKGRREIGALKKYYFTDLGLRNARLNFAFGDEGQLLENLVYNELLYHNYSVSVGEFDTIEKDKLGHSIRKGNEVDFYARRDEREIYVQVCSDISSEETRKREIRPYFLLNDQVQKILVVNRPFERCKDENGFTVIGMADFLLRFIP